MISLYLCAIRVTTLKHNNERLRNTNGCYLVTQFSSSSTNRLILSELSFLAKVKKKIFPIILFNKVRTIDEGSVAKRIIIWP